MSSKYAMYLTFNNENASLEFPQLPEQISISQGGNNTSLDVVGLGEVVVIGDRPAASISFEGVFSAEDCTPQDYVDKIKSWIEAKLPVHLIVTGTDINIFCAFASFNWWEQGGDVGSLYYSMVLTEYREPTVSTITVSDATAIVETTETRVDNRVSDVTYTVQSGDCLYNIAKAKLGDGALWGTIAELNSISSPYTIYPNQVLKLEG